MRTYSCDINFLMGEHVLLGVTGVRYKRLKGTSSKARKLVTVMYLLFFIKLLEKFSKMLLFLQRQVFC